MKDYIHVVREFDRARMRKEQIEDAIGGTIIIAVFAFIGSLDFKALESLFLWK